MATPPAAKAELPPDLAAAIKVGDISITESLYATFKAANISSQASLLNQMAILAARHSHPHILSYCFKNGLTLNLSAVNDPLVYAANDSASVPIFDVLINEGGWDVNQYLELEGDALTSAVYKGNVELAEWLLAKGADPNSDYPLGEYTSLLWAIVGDRNQGSTGEKMLRLLLDHGAIVKRTGALIAAAEHGNLKAVEMILNMRSEEVDLEEVEEYGAYDERKLDDMGTALYKAAAGGWVEIVDILLRKGADREFRDCKGRSVTDVARENGCESVLTNSKIMHAVVRSLKRSQPLVHEKIDFVRSTDWRMEESGGVDIIAIADMIKELHLYKKGVEAPRFNTYSKIAEFRIGNIFAIRSHHLSGAPFVPQKSRRQCLANRQKAKTSKDWKISTPARLTRHDLPNSIRLPEPISEKRDSNPQIF
ncbi:MAG: hypothetical protein Q9225_005429 [Loekoesia sp. 1 TL-2023]